MSNNTKNVWDQMVLFNQLTLFNILNGREDLGTPKLRAAVASLKVSKGATQFVSSSAVLRSWLACLTVKAYRQWSMSAPFWTAFQLFNFYQRSMMQLYITV